METETGPEGVGSFGFPLRRRSVQIRARFGGRPHYARDQQRLSLTASRSRASRKSCFQKHLNIWGLLTHPSADGYLSRRAPRERAVFLNDSNPLPVGRSLPVSSAGTPGVLSIQP